MPFGQVGLGRPKNALCSVIEHPAHVDQLEDKVATQKKSMAADLREKAAEAEGLKIMFTASQDVPVLEVSTI